MLLSYPGSAPSVTLCALIILIKIWSVSILQPENEDLTKARTAASGWDDLQLVD